MELATDVVDADLLEGAKADAWLRRPAAVIKTVVVLNFILNIFFRFD